MACPQMAITVSLRKLLPQMPDRGGHGRRHASFLSNFRVFLFRLGSKRGRKVLKAARS